MKATFWAGIALTAIGLFGLILSIVTGKATLLFVLIVPVIVLEGFIPVVSVVLIMIGTIMLMVRHLSAEGMMDRKSSKGRRSWGGIAMIGPVPITFGDMSGSIPLSIRIPLYIMGAIALVILIAVLMMNLL